jgi:hypothetical protein
MLEIDVREVNLNVRPATWIACAVLLAGTCGQARADYIASTLGLAGPDYYAVLALTGANSTMLTGPATTSGNVGVSSGNLTLSGTSGTVVSGNVYLASGATLGSGGSQVTGTVSTNQNLSLVNTDALAAAAAFNALTPTQTVPGGAVTSTTTITGTSGVNVVDISNLNLNNQTLTLNGPAGSQFIINDSGGFTLSSGQILLTGGVTSQDVVFNVTSSDPITTSGTTSITGNILATNSNVSMSPGLLSGELIAGGSTIGLSSVQTGALPSHGFSVVPFAAPVVPSVPEPPAALLLGLGAVIGLSAASRFRRAQILRA